MKVGTKATFVFPIIGMIFVSLLVPAFAEVETILTDKLFYTVDDVIHFSGTVSEDSTGLVTIVIRDSNDEFVMLSQAFINSDDTFEKDVIVNAKFLDHGIYKAIAFIKDLDAGSSTQFDFSINGSPVVPSVTSVNPEIVPSKTQDETDDENTKNSTEQTTEQNPVKPVIFTVPAFVDPLKDPKYYVDRYYNEPEYKAWFDTYYPDLTIEEAVGLDKQQENTEPKIIEEESIVTKFQQYIDESKDPQYYVDRYYNEPAYKAWFDSNFPDETIYAALGVPVPGIKNSTETSEIVEPEPEIIPPSEISSNKPSTNSEFSQLLLAVGGIGVLFGAVYGIKRKVDTNTEQIEANKTMLQKRVNKNSEQISQNRFWLKKKLNVLKPNSDPIDLIRNRLAKGEISVEEFQKLSKALQKNR